MGITAETVQWYARLIVKHVDTQMASVLVTKDGMVSIAQKVIIIKKKYSSYETEQSNCYAILKTSLPIIRKGNNETSNGSYTLKIFQRVKFIRTLNWKGHLL